MAAIQWEGALGKTHRYWIQMLKTEMKTKRRRGDIRATESLPCAEVSKY